MTVDKIARDIWIKSHMAALLSKRAQQLGNSATHGRGSVTKSGG
jgi:hypothetical protein